MNNGRHNNAHVYTTSHSCTRVNVRVCTCGRRAFGVGRACEKVTPGENVLPAAGEICKRAINHIVSRKRHDNGRTGRGVASGKK